MKLGKNVAAWDSCFPTLAAVKLRRRWGTHFVLDLAEGKGRPPGSPVGLMGVWILSGHRVGGVYFHWSQPAEAVGL